MSFNEHPDAIKSTDRAIQAFVIAVTIEQCEIKLYNTLFESPTKVVFMTTDDKEEFLDFVDQSIKAGKMTIVKNVSDKKGFRNVIKKNPLCHFFYYLNTLEGGIKNRS